VLCVILGGACFVIGRGFLCGSCKFLHCCWVFVVCVVVCSYLFLGYLIVFWFGYCVILVLCEVYWREERVVVWGCRVYGCKGL